MPKGTAYGKNTFHGLEDALNLEWMATMGLDLDRIFDKFLDGVPKPSAYPIYCVFQAVVHKQFRKGLWKMSRKKGEGLKGVSGIPASCK